MRDPCRDYASEANDDHKPRPEAEPVRPLYTPYRYGSHCWAFDAAIGRPGGFDSRSDAQAAADKQKADDEAECRDPKRDGILTWAMQKTLAIYPPGMSESDDPLYEPSELTAR